MTKDFATTLSDDLTKRKAGGESKIEALRFAEIQCGKANQEFNRQEKSSTDPDVFVDGRELLDEIYPDEAPTAPRRPVAPVTAAPMIGAPVAPAPVAAVEPPAPTTTAQRKKAAADAAAAATE